LSRPRELAKVEDLFRQACAAFQAGNLVEAEDLYRKLVRAQPDHLGALNFPGILLTRLGKFGEAERFISSTLRINDGSDATHYNLGERSMSASGGYFQYGRDNSK
jgi:Flp pilus assembly protein TadD